MWKVALTEQKERGRERRRQKRMRMYSRRKRSGYASYKTSTPMGSSSNRAEEHCIAYMASQRSFHSERIAANLPRKYHNRITRFL